jgi:hypothetical protein
MPVVRPDEYLEVYSQCRASRNRGIASQSQYCLHAHEHCWYIEGLEEYLRCYISILARI